MSSLEQIRKHPGLVITVLGAALVLFIITGVSELPALFSTNRDTVAKVDGTSLKYNDLMQRTQELQAMYKQRGMSNVDYAQIEQEALEQMISETLINNAVDRLGITVTDAEMQSILFGQNAAASAVQAANQYGFATPEEFYQYAYSSEPGAESVRQLWNDMEKNLREQLTIQKYTSQLGALTANKLDAKSYYDDNAQTSTVVVVKSDYAALPDDEFKPTDAEIAERYKQMKERFAIPTEQRLVDYILVRPNPSQDDYVTAQQEVETALEGLRTLPSTDAVAANYNFEVTNLVGPESAINDNAIKNAIPELKADSAGVKLISFANNKYTIAKLLDTYSASDSVYLDIALINTADGASDSIVAQLNAGVDPSALGESILNSQLDLGLPMIQTALTSYKDQFAAAPAGQYFVPDNNEGLFQALTGQTSDHVAVAVRVNRFTSPKEIFQIAKVVRDVEPSSTTINLLKEEVAGYIAANPTAEQFKASSNESKYDVLTTTVNPSMLTLLNLPSSGAAARWAMENKKGAVSDIFSDDSNSYILVLAVEDIYKDYLPVNSESVNTEISNRLVAEKKGVKLVGDLKGKANDIPGYASLMNATPDTVTVTYGQDYVRGFYPGDPNLLANVAVAEEGKVVGPIDTRNSVVVLQVTGVEQQGREFDYDNDAAAFNRAQGVNRLQQRFQNILRGNKKVSYSIQRFTNAD